MKPGDLINLLLLALLFACAVATGAMQQKHFCRKEAVAAGVAHWTVDAAGKTKFEYNK